MIRTGWADERHLWTLFGVLLVAAHPSDEWCTTSWTALLLWIVRPYVHHGDHRQPSTGALWRNDGRELGIALILLPSLFVVLSTTGSTPSASFASYAKVAPWALFLHPWIQRGMLGVPKSAEILSWAALGVGLWIHQIHQQYALAYWIVSELCFGSLPVPRKEGTASSLAGVLTRDEWQVLTGLVTVVLLEGTDMLSASRQDGSHNDLHLLVAWSGNLGCLLATILLSPHRRSLTVATQIGLAAVLPLGVVEGCLRFVEFDRGASPFSPRCMVWLVSFLSKSERPLVDSPTEYEEDAVGIPRYGWLLYWAIVLMGSFLCAPKTTSATSSVVARKYFHAVAVLLFGPVTFAAPTLLSLAYAVAVAILLTLEGLRRQLPVLQGFYGAYLDTSKDQADRFLVSHVALLLGCAVPLWCYEVAGASTTETLPPLLPFVGVILLGVGDALGAVVGLCLGRTRWSTTNARTVEGSVAMLLGQMVAAGVLSCLYRVPLAWASTVGMLVFATLLEAWTTQMDNLILPVAGTVVLSLLQRM
jgi:dolichol kinase